MSKRTDFRAPSTSCSPYAHAHDERTKANTQPLPIAQEGPTGTRSARRRPLAKAGTLEHEQHRNGERTLRSEGPSMPQRGTDSQARSNAKRVLQQETTTDHRRGDKPQAHYVSAVCPPPSRSNRLHTDHKLFRSIGIAGCELGRAGARCDGPSLSARDGRECAFVRLCDTSIRCREHGMSVNEHDRPDCLYRRADCSYQKRVRRASSGGHSRGQSAAPAPSLGAGMARTRNPRRRSATTPAIHFWGTPPCNFLEIGF